jgi:hypothetical protein
MAEQYLEQPVQEPPAPPEKETDQPAWQYANALVRTLKAQADPYISKFAGYRSFLFGKGHWRAARTQSAKTLEGWAFRGVVNDLYAVHDTKVSTLSGSPSQVTVEPVGEDSTELQRLEIKSVIEDEMKRVSFDRVKKDLVQWGSETGIGVAMWSARPDALTGDMELFLQALNPGEVFCDSDCFETANVWVWWPLLKMSQLRRMWPEKAKQIVPDLQPTGATPSETIKADSTDDNLIYGSAGEFIVDSQGIKERKARCAFVWIKDPDAIIEELRETVLQEATPGLRCVSCGETFDQDSMPDGLTSINPCPVCGGDLHDVTIPPKTKVDRIVQRAYPYGRLMVISGKHLIYDGENPYEIEEVFPGAAYHHFRIPGILYGFGDVALLRSLQEETNTTIGQVIDYIRLCVNGVTIYPIGFKGLSTLGNTPGEKIPGPDHAPWLPYILSPTGFNVSAAQLGLNALEHHFIVVAGLGDISGQASSPPISATEVEVTANRTSARMKGHATELGICLSRLCSIQWQMMKQFYVKRRATVQIAPTHLRNVEVEMQALPSDVRIRVDLSLEAAQMDKLQKQVLQGFIAQGGLEHPDADILLETFGANPARIKELMQRKALRQETGVPAPPPPVQGEPATLNAGGM